MSRVIIASAQEDFAFPLAEAARKQILARARQVMGEGGEAQIVLATCGDESQETRHGVPLTLTSGRRFGAVLGDVDGDILEYWGVPGRFAWTAARSRRHAHKALVLTDGGVFSVGRNVGLRRLLAAPVFRRYDRIGVFTYHQAEIVAQVEPRVADRLVPLRPLLGPLSNRPHRRLSSTPTMLFMGHPSYFKGIDLVIMAFRRLANEFGDLRLVVADNGLGDGQVWRQKLRWLKEEYPNRVFLKGKVNPEAELLRASVLLSPLRQVAGTFAFPLSLYESLICGTPFLTSRLPGIEEFFDDQFLTTPGDLEALVTRTRTFLAGDFQDGAINQNLERIQSLYGCETAAV